MKQSRLIFLIILLLSNTFSVNAQIGCNNWLKVDGNNLRSGVQFGDLDITGHSVTVEAQINATYLSIPGYYGGDIVSKHGDPNDVNYLLRAERAEINTTNGYYTTPDACRIELNKTYHVAMVYDGSKLKFYRDGYLMSQVSCTGDMILNNWNGIVGATASTNETIFTGFYGYINEVRIWNVARTQAQIKQYMNLPLPNPSGQTGLLAYYTFDNLINEQGNGNWNGQLISPATINNNNPQCGFGIDSCGTTSVITSFSSPDSICVDSNVVITNTSSGASTYNWSFCSGDFSTTIDGTNIGNPDNNLTQPVWMDYALDGNGNYYGFVTNHTPGTLTRLNFGKSLLNTPTSDNMGNFGGALPNQCEGVQIVQAAGKWNVIIVGGGNSGANASPRIIKLDFGASLANTPLVTNWGNVGNLLNLPHDIFITKEGSNYYGLTVNALGNNLIRLNFGSDFSAPPVATNLGNPGNFFNYPEGLSVVENNGNWYAFVANGLGQNILRFDFGSSIVNIPTAVNLGNPGGNFSNPRDISILSLCSGISGLVADAGGSSYFLKLDFGNSIISTPTCTNIGNVGSVITPHSISKFFIENNNIYSFVTNSSGGTITRIRYKGCGSPSSILQNPLPFKYSTPGTYNIELITDIGLPTQQSLCKDILVKDCSTPAIAGFTVKDTVCVDSLLTINNTSSGGSTYNWSFCAPDVNALPTGTNLGNISSSFKQPVFQDIVKGDDGNFYGFQVNHDPGSLLRLNYGTSLLNTPTVQSLGNLGGVFPKTMEGIEVIKNGSNWYVIVVGGDPVGGSVSSRIIKVDFGTVLTNNSPSATNWGNIGSLAFPVDFKIIKENGNYYGYTVNVESNSITKFDFGTSFINPPTGINLGNVGNLNLPTGFSFVNNNGNWFAFITNQGSNTLTRLSFGTSINNLPAGINIGNASNLMKEPRDIAIINTCSGIFGYALNAHDAPVDGNILKLDFGTNILNAPTAVKLGSLGNLGFPHSFTEVISEGNDMYTFIDNVSNNTITRIKIPGCTNATPSSSNLQNPPKVKYSSPGTYNIILTVDIGMPTEYTYCKEVVAKDCFDACAGFGVNAGKDTTICPGNSVQLNATGADTYKWNSSPYLSNLNIANPVASPLVTTNFIVTGTNLIGCSATDTVKITVRPRPAFTLTNDTTICIGTSAQLNAFGSGITNYSWTPSTGLSATNISNPVASPSDTTEYFVTVTDGNGCKNTDSVTVNVQPLPIVSTISDTSICNGTSVVLNTAGSNSNTYQWSPATGLNSTSIKSPVATPSVQTKYVVTASTSIGCKNKDSVTVSLYPVANVTASKDSTICHDTQIQLFASGGVSYSWTPASSLNNANISNPIASPSSTTNYVVSVTDANTCKYKDMVVVTVIPKGSFSITPDQSICLGGSATISASGGLTYNWQPASAFTDPTQQMQIVSPTITTTYIVSMQSDNICKDTGNRFTTVFVNPLPDVVTSKDNDIDCVTNTAQLHAEGASSYVWSPATGLNSTTIANPVSTTESTILYTVTGTDDLGCVSSDTVTVRLTNAGQDIFQMASAFTPNGDGLNDCFGVRKWGDIITVQFEIYNKWGNLVFRTSNPDECWDGTYNGKKQPSEVYVYWVKATTKFCGDIFRKGTVVVLR